MTSKIDPKFQKDMADFINDAFKAFDKKHHPIYDPIDMPKNLKALGPLFSRHFSYIGKGNKSNYFRKVQQAALYQCFLGAHLLKRFKLSQLFNSNPKSTDHCFTYSWALTQYMIDKTGLDFSALADWPPCPLIKDKIYEKAGIKACTTEIMLDELRLFFLAKANSLIKTDLKTALHFLYEAQLTSTLFSTFLTKTQARKQLSEKLSSLIKARHANSAKQKDIDFVMSLWKEKGHLYKNKTRFANDAITKCEFLKDPRTIIKHINELLKVGKIEPLSDD